MPDKVSIIIPIYNAADYLDNCLSSIINLTYKNTEIIIVNDGSTDNSSEICEEYAKSDSRIRIINQKNSGPSSARNTGIVHATGKYIQFVDSDDSVRAEITEKLIQTINSEIDLAICGYKLISKTEGVFSEQNIYPSINGVFNMDHFLNYFGELFKVNLIHSPCNKLYKTELIRKYNIKFEENIHMGEDLLFNLEYLIHCKRISVIQDTLYNYLIYNNTKSLTSKYKESLFENQQMLFYKVREFLNKNNVFFGKNKDFIEINYTSNIVSVINHLFHMDSGLTFKTRKKEILKIINDKNVRSSLKYFDVGSMQKRFIGYMIKNKNVLSIYFYFLIKEFIRKNSSTIFSTLKRMSGKGNIKT